MGKFPWPVDHERTAAAFARLHWQRVRSDDPQAVAAIRASVARGEAVRLRMPFSSIGPCGGFLITDRQLGLADVELDVALVARALEREICADPIVQARVAVAVTLVFAPTASGA